jgi:hypothetical protein
LAFSNVITPCLAYAASLAGHTQESTPETENDPQKKRRKFNTCNEVFQRSIEVAE